MALKTLCWHERNPYDQSQLVPHNWEWVYLLQTSGNHHPFFLPKISIRTLLLSGSQDRWLFGETWRYPMIGKSHLYAALFNPCRSPLHSLELCWPKMPKKAAETQYCQLAERNTFHPTSCEKYMAKEPSWTVLFQFLWPMLSKASNFAWACVRFNEIVSSFP